jgi:hypothetical protein
MDNHPDRVLRRRDNRRRQGHRLPRRARLPHGSTFTGTVNWVLIETGDDDHSHLIGPEQQMMLHLAQH